MRVGKKSSKYQVGQIIMVAYPYQEQPEITKNRPGLIISIEQNELVVLPITSQEKYRGDPCYIEVILRKTSFINFCRNKRFDADGTYNVIETLDQMQLQLVLRRWGLQRGR